MKDKKAKIIFFGNTEFSNKVLDECNKNFDVVFVVTNPSKKMGRGQKYRHTPVMEFSKRNSLNVVECEDLKDPKFHKKLAENNVDLFIVVAYKILPKELLNIPDSGCINLHSSMLPKYRGAAPIQHAILNLDKETGVSTFLIEPKVDTGKVILQEKVDISINDNFGTLSEKLSKVGSKLMITSIKKVINNEADLIVQDENDVSKAPKIQKKDLEITWAEKASKIDAKIRAFSPYPGAFSFIDNKRIKIFKSEVVKSDSISPPGNIVNIEKDFFEVKCKKGSLRIFEVQIEGKNRMKSNQFINGYNNLEKSILG